MKAYLFTITAAAMAAALVGLLSPERFSKSIRLLSSLMLVCVLILPIKDGIHALLSWDPANWEAPKETALDAEELREQFENATASASRTYVAQALGETLAQKFSLEPGTVRCRLEWKQNKTVTRVTVLLSGSSIWKDPHEIEEFTEALLGCECVMAVE